jgi:hypothetical protein
MLCGNAICSKIGGRGVLTHSTRPYHNATGVSDMTKARLISIDYLHKVLICDAEAGKLYWKYREDVPPNVRSRLTGRPAINSVQKNGYARGAVDGTFVLAHRVIWAMTHGEWPDEIDHINGIRHDNRMCNLRNVTKKENAKNLSLQSRNTSGYIGVTWYKAYQKWAAAIVVNKKRVHLGYFDDVHQAGKVRRQAEVKYGFHKNHGAR